MFLLGDYPFNRDDKLKCLLSLSTDQVIEPDDLNQFKENESLCSVSREELEKRLMKSFSINITEIELMLQKKLSLNECVRLCHYAIDMANTKVKSGGKRSGDGSAGPSDTKKARKLDDDEHMIQNEVDILKTIKHLNIIELIEEFDSHTELFLVMELVKGGDLFDAIAMATKYSEKDACIMIFILAWALQYLHVNDIVHRDVKPENLLVCGHGDGTKSLKLGDFVFATSCTEPLYTVCGTLTYVAPEILKENGYGAKVDVWAAGVIMYILLCGYSPFSSAENVQDELFDAILDGELEFLTPYWDGISDKAKDLVTKMLTNNPIKRCTAEDVTKHDWIIADNLSDYDIHRTITKEIKSHFRWRSSKLRLVPLALVAATALDKESKYFEGRKPLLTLPVSDGQKNKGDDDEMF